MSKEKAKISEEQQRTKATIAYRRLYRNTDIDLDEETQRLIDNHLTDLYNIQVEYESLSLYRKLRRRLWGI